MSNRKHTFLWWIAAFAIASASIGAQVQRPNLGVGGSNWTPRTGTDFGLVVQDLATGITPAQLAQSMLSGTGVTISNVQFSGVPVSAGAFTTTNPAILGFSSGIMLSSGNVNSVIGPNLADTAAMWQTRLDEEAATAAEGA